MRRFYRYGFAVAVAFLAILVKLSLSAPADQAAYFWDFAAVALAGWYFG